MTSIPIGDVDGAQHLRCVVSSGKPDSKGSPTLDLVMDVYTGWLTFTHASNDFAQANVVSFVPLGTGTGTNVDIQNYVGGASAIVSASISSFADDPDLAAVDRARVKLTTHNFPGFTGQVLVLNASVAVQEGKLHRVSYQVTALVTAKEPSRALAELDETVLSIDRGETP
jgi:hypothetical protein